MACGVRARHGAPVFVLKPILMRRLCNLLIGVFCVVGMAATQPPRFEPDVLPIVTAKCLSCHGGNSMVGLDLRTAASLFKGSHNGPVLVKGSPEESLLYEKISSRMMPPEAFKRPLTEAEIETIRLWIEGGALSDAKEEIVLSEQQVAKFEQEALPVFKERCTACHSGEQPMGGLDLRTLESLLRGSHNGPVIVEGSADASILIRKVAAKAMPPPGTGQPLNDQEIEQLRLWVDTSRFDIRPDRAGAEREIFTEKEAPPVTEEDRQFWAFRKPVNHPLPKVGSQDRVRTPIDAYVLAKLESEGLTFSPNAPKETLLRRAYFDLIGLPPTLDEIEEFLSDTGPDAYERLIDRLLDSPHYGERWGRYWLDAAGYTDTTGFDNDLPTIHVFEGMWRYRDYVVQSLNDDKPYDRFVTEQLAGDELVDWRNAETYTPEILESLIATGYLRTAFDRTDPDITNLFKERHDVLFGLIEKVSTGLMGLTVGCARCHSHRFDPIPQRDYYRFLALFMSAYNPMAWKQPKNRFLPDVSKPEQEEIDRHNAEIEKPLKKLEEEMASLRQPYEDMLLDQKLDTLPEEIRADAKTALRTEEEERTDVQKYLVEKFGKKLEVTPEEVDEALKGNEQHWAEKEKLDRQIATLEGYKRSYGKIQALWDVGPPPVVRLLQRGAVESPGPRVKPGFLTVLAPPGKSDFVRPAERQGQTSGHRLALARWLTSPENPLTARVAVNRTWQHHFGVGIVATPENFGELGTRPTHPELLDWLAVDFMKNGWRMKRLHRMIMTSTVYRQSSRQTGTRAHVAAKKTDPLNKLLWRMNMRRLEAEAVRDAIIDASGKLDRTLGGKAILIEHDPSGLQTIDRNDPTPNAKWRRSLYVLARRNYPLNFLEVFDYPLMQTNCNRRINSATPVQSLTLMNDEFVVEHAEHLRDWVNGITDGTSPEAKIETAYQLTLSRRPTPKETQLSLAHLDKQQELYRKANFTPDKASAKALASLCQMLLASNEFLYVE